jgi:hypothetical protein
MLFHKEWATGKNYLANYTIGKRVERKGFLLNNP